MLSRSQTVSCVLIADQSCSDVGTGAVYSFDPVGSYEREACRAAGAAQSLIQPFLDNQVSPQSPPISSFTQLEISLPPHCHSELLHSAVVLEELILAPRSTSAIRPLHPVQPPLSLVDFPSLLSSVS